MAFMKQVRYITPLCVKTSFVIPFFIDVNIKKKYRRLGKSFWIILLNIELIKFDY